MTDHRQASRDRNPGRATRAIAGAVLIVVAALGSGPSAAADGRPDPPGRSEGNHCVTDSGTDLNVLFGVAEQIVNRFCTHVTAGERWRPFALWVTNTANELFPDGYVPQGATPAEDLRQKLVSIRVVIDGGTPRERTSVFTPTEALRTDVTVDRLEPGFPALPMTVAMPRMDPLSVGDHTREVIWVLTAVHCDGFGTSPADNCIPGGEASFGTASFSVTSAGQSSRRNG